MTITKYYWINSSDLSVMGNKFSDTNYKILN